MTGLKCLPHTACGIMSLAGCEIPHSEQCEIEAAGSLIRDALSHPSTPADAEYTPSHR